MRWAAAAAVIWDRSPARTAAKMGSTPPACPPGLTFRQVPLERGWAPQDRAGARGEDYQPGSPRRAGAGVRDWSGDGRDRFLQRAVGGHRPWRRRLGDPAARPVEEPGSP